MRMESRGERTRRERGRDELEVEKEDIVAGARDNDVEDVE
jgi:hypothetical protein